MNFTNTIVFASMLAMTANAANNSGVPNNTNNVPQQEEQMPAVQEQSGGFGAWLKSWFVTPEVPSNNQNMEQNEESIEESSESTGPVANDVAQPEVVEEKPTEAAQKQPVGWGAWFRSFIFSPDDEPSDSESSEESSSEESSSSSSVEEKKKEEEKKPNNPVPRRNSPISFGPQNNKPAQPTFVGVPNVNRPGVLPPVQQPERIPEPTLTGVPKIPMPENNTPFVRKPVRINQAPLIKPAEVVKPPRRISTSDSDDDIIVITPLSMQPAEPEILVEQVTPVSLTDNTSGASFTVPSVLAGAISAVLFLAL